MVGELAEKAGVSIYAVLQVPFTDPENVDFVITTEPSKFSQVGTHHDPPSPPSVLIVHVAKDPVSDD